MFIVHDSWEIVHRSVRSETLVSEKHISLRYHPTRAARVGAPGLERGSYFRPLVYGEFNFQVQRRYSISLQRSEMLIDNAMKPIPRSSGAQCFAP
jgi:hypothetical protein